VTAFGQHSEQDNAVALQVFIAKNTMLMNSI